MIEQLRLGLAAYRAGRITGCDGATGKVIDSPEANALLLHWVPRTRWGRVGCAFAGVARQGRR